MFEVEDDLEVTKQAPKLPKQVWACNCKHDRRGKTLTQFHTTTVTKEGVCKRCQHYAVKMDALRLV